jgi:integrase-like protein
MVVPGDQSHRYVVHDHDSIYPGGCRSGDRGDGTDGPQGAGAAPQANAFCERLIGTIRRECPDFVIPLNERHVRHVLRAWVAHYKSRSPAHQPWARAFPTRRAIASRRCPVAIRFVIVIASSRNRFSAECTTSIVSSRWPHDPAGAPRQFSQGKQLRLASPRSFTMMTR